MAKMLDDAIADYLTYRKGAFSRGTVLASEQSLRQFLAVTGNIQTKSLSPKHAERFQLSLLSSGKAIHGLPPPQMDVQPAAYGAESACHRGRGLRDQPGG